MTIVNEAANPVLFFDGECNLCSSAVQFVIRKDRKGQFLFSPLQSDAGKEALQTAGVLPSGAGTVVLYYNGKYYLKSSAALHTLQLLGGGWQLLFALMVIPRFIRDGMYDLIARNRHKWFGRSTGCMVPTPELQRRFITTFQGRNVGHGRA